MDERYVKSVEEMVAWAEEDEGIQGIVIIGSQVRSYPPHTEWSDLDVLLLVDDPEVLKKNTAWLRRFGTVAIATEEVVDFRSAHLTWYVKRPLYTDNRAIDFCILPFDRLDTVLSVNKEIHARGYRVVYDASGKLLTEKIQESVDTVPESTSTIPAEPEIDAVVNDLLYHVIWAFKKSLSHELWVAVNCINCYMRDRLIQLVEYHNTVFSQSDVAVTYSGRFLEERTDQTILEKLKGCFSDYDRANVMKTLLEIAERSGTQPPRCIEPA